VSLEKGQLVVRTLDVVYEPTAVLFQGQTHTNYQKAEILKTKHFELTMVKVYDVRGKSVPKRELPQLLKKETVALVSTDQQAVDPLNLGLFKDGMLLFVLPAPPPPPVVPPPPVAPAAGVSYVPAPASAGVGAPTVLVAPPTEPLPSAEAFLQEDPEVLVVHSRTVRVPVHVASDQRAAVQRLHLYASTDKGKTWEQVSTISADRDSFVFQAPGLGLYWFVVQVVRRDGKTDPSDLGETVRPRLKVLIKGGGER
jgi:hypothetical protein